MKKKKYIKIALVLIFIVVLFVISNILIKALNSKSLNGEKYITDSDYLYEIAANYILDSSMSNNPDNTKSNFNGFVSYDKFGVTKKGNKKYVYMWGLLDYYYKENGKLKNAGGSSIFYKVTFENDVVINTEIPEDGNYSESIKKVCIDNNMYKKIIKYKTKLSNDKKAKEYYSNIE